MRRTLPAILALALVAGCAKKPAPAPIAPVAPPPDAQALFDGTYRGTSTRYQADARSCPGPGLVTLHVEGGAFDYRWSSKVKLPVQIAADRSLTLGDAGPQGDISMKGRATPGAIEGDVTSPSCGYHFTVRKRG